ncbi:DNA cytosine methyltransferase [Microbacterium sp. LMI1-1-1.1]|uniref:DNA cytosine methyltransferase n=1 Tax=Microbacterium sp. LMI1-1-1.1 TaxID=3135223 RepID=UPI003467919B
MPRNIRVLDLFAGAGGLTAGFREGSERFTSVAAVEMDLAAAASYEATFGEGIVFAGTIEDWLDTQPMPTSIDVVVGGPPCQGFSTLGKRDEEDLRNGLWRLYGETITRVQPKYFVVENVAAFEKSKQFRQFVEATEPGGFLEEYVFQHRVLNAADYGAPQARKRAVLIGHRRSLPFPGFPEPTHAPTATANKLRYGWVEDAFLGIPGEPDRDHVFGSKSTEFAGRRFAGPFSPRELHWSRDYTDLSKRRMAAIPAGGNRFNIREEDLAPCWREHRTGSADVMGRLHLDRPSVTIRTEFFKPEKGRYLHPTKDRAISHYEAAVLQGFPADHKFVGSRTAIARQIGNAVPIPLGAAIGRQLASVL